jgi:vacuolar-type H+-ATPase subunit H
MKVCLLFATGFTLATLLWVLGPVYWVLRKDPRFTIFSYASWLLASNESNFCLTATLAALIVMASSVICRYVWSRIRVRHDLDINRRTAEVEAREKASNAHVITTKQKAEREAQAIIARAKEKAQEVMNGAMQESNVLMEKAQAEAANLKSLSQEESRQFLDCARKEAATVTGQAGEEDEMVLDGARQESAKIVAQAQDLTANLELRNQEEVQGVDKVGQRIRVWERFSPFQDLPESETSPYAIHEPGQVETKRTLSEIAILVGVHGLSARQAKALEHISENGSINIQEFEHLYPDISRRTLQRDLKEMINFGLLILEGATHHTIYRQKT